MRTGPTSGFRSAGRNISSSRLTRAVGELGVERIDLWQLHRIDPKVPRDEQFGAIAAMMDDGLIRHAGLSEVSVEEIEAAASSSRSRPCRTATTCRSRERGRARPLRGNTSASFRGSRSRPAARARRLGGTGHDRPQARSDARPDRARLAPEAQPGHAADPRHGTSRISRRTSRRRRSSSATPNSRRSIGPDASRADTRALQLLNTTQAPPAASRRARSSALRRATARAGARGRTDGSRGF